MLWQAASTDARGFTSDVVCPGLLPAAFLTCTRGGALRRGLGSRTRYALPCVGCCLHPLGHLPGGVMERVPSRRMAWCDVPFVNRVLGIITMTVNG